METVVETEKLNQALNSLVGKPLWATVGCQTTATSVLFNFGRKIPAKDVYENPTVSEKDVFVGEVSLMVHCSWRIETGQTRLVCGCGDLHNAGGPMFQGLEKLVGSTVIEVSLNSFLDLLVAFGDGRQLRLFCDRKEDETGYGHYDLSIIYAHERVSYAAVDGVIKRERESRSVREKE